MVKTRRFRGGTRMRRTKSMRGGAGYNIYLEDGTPYLHFRTNSHWSSDDLSVEKLLEKLNNNDGQRYYSGINEKIRGLKNIQKIREDESTAEQDTNASNYYRASMIVRPNHLVPDSERADVIIVRHKDRNEARRIFNEQSGIARRAAILMNERGELADQSIRSSGPIQGNMRVGRSGYYRRPTARSTVGTHSPPPPLSEDDDDSWGYAESGRGRKKKKKKKSRKKKKKKHHKKKSKGGSLTHTRR